MHPPHNGALPIADTMNQTRTEAQIHMKNLSLHTEVNQLYKKTKGVPEDSTEVSLFRNSSLHTKAQYVPTNATRKEFEKTEKKNWEEFEKDKTRIEEEMLYIRNGTASLSDF